ncbi:transposase [Robbsia andropogonis]
MEPLLPLLKPRHKLYSGSLPIWSSAALNCILIALNTGMRWNHVPTRLVFDPRATCWSQLHHWQQALVREKLHALLLDKLR